MKPTSQQGKLEKDHILHTCQELILKWVRVNFSHCLEAIEDKLFKLSDQADNNEDQTHFYQACKELQLYHQPLQQRYLKHIQQAFSHYQQLQHTAADYTLDPRTEQSTAVQAEDLSLIDNSELEEQLAIGTISRKLSVDCSELLYALNQRFSALSQGKKITDRGNPVSPAVFAEGMQQAIHILNLDDRAKILIYKIFETVFMGKVKKLYDLLNHELKTHGVLPNLSHTVAKNPSTQPPIEQQLPDELQYQLNEASINHQVTLFETISQLQRQLRPAHYRPPQTGTPLLTEQVIAGIQQLQLKAATILNNLNTPQEVASSNYQHFQPQAAPVTAKTNQVDKAVVEIVGLLFEYMLNDEQLPDSVKALLSYLHTPFLKIALLDKNFFDHPEHPARQLLNSLVAAGERWVEPVGKHKSDVFQQIKSVVERLLKDYAGDVRLFSELAFEFNQYLRQHARRIRLAEKRAQQAAQGENKLKEIRLKVDGYLKKKIGDLPLPPAISTLLFEPWANFLSFNLLRFGSRSEQWRQAAETVDDILWYSQTHSIQDSHARSRTEELRHTLPGVLRAGFDTVGYDSTQAEHLLNSLLKQQASLPANSTAASPITANIDEVDISQHAATAIRNDELLLTLKKTGFGTWFEFKADTKTPHRVKLAWSNTNTLHFMFVNRLGQQVAVKSGEQLASEIRGGSVKILSTLEDKPFFEKAMERVLEQLKHRQQNSPD